MELKSVQFENRPHKMWAWNEKLNTVDINEHISRIADAGFGSFCICARPGLQTKFRGDIWYRNISSAIKKAYESGLSVWVSDDFGIPSGSGFGSINSLGLEYQQKFLRCDVGESTNDRTIVCKDGYHFYFDVNPFYVDILNPEVPKLFSEASALNSETPVVVLSEQPSLSHMNIPWSFALPAHYKAEYGEELLDVLPELFHKTGNFRLTRIKFWSLISKLVAENYICTLRTKANEDNNRYALAPLCQNAYDFTSNGDMMLDFLYTDIPVVNIKSKESLSALYPLMASSVKEQFNKRESVSILFENSGHGATFSDLRRFSNLQFAYGITRVATAPEPMSLNGFRKRVSSTVSYLRDDILEAHRRFCDELAVINSAMSQGYSGAETLLLNNLTAKWIEFDSIANERVDSVALAMNDAINQLTAKHIPFHIGSELVLREHASVCQGKLYVGKQCYTTIVLPEDTVLLPETEKLLSEFEAAGGFITYASSLSSNDICDNDSVVYTNRICKDFSIHYFFNDSNEKATVCIKAGTKMLDVSTGEIVPFHGIYDFNPYEAIIVIQDGTPELPRPFVKELKTLDISGEWSVKEPYENVFVLDRCDLFSEGMLIADGINAADVTELMYSRKTSCEVECVFKFNICEEIDTLYIKNDSISKHRIKINGISIDPGLTDSGEEISVSSVNIAEFINIGENYISIGNVFSPSDKFLNSYENAKISENERARITYDTEIEALYLTGEFSVITDGDFLKLDKNTYRYVGEFSLGKKRDGVNLSSLHTQGLPFFAGKLHLSKKFNLSDIQYCIKFIPHGITAISVIVNGKKLAPVFTEPYEVNLSDYLIKGDNEIEFEISTTLRNVFGPHHIPLGELYTVNAGDYYNTRTIWNNNKETPWNNNYCLSEFSIDS